MNKQKILELTGLSEDQFYDQYPDQETFCSDYPDACNQLEEAQGGMQVGKVYDKYGNETFTPAPDPIHSDWQINEEGMNVRPRTVDRFGNPIGPTTQVLRIPVDRVPFNREPTMQRLNPAIQSLQHESANNVPTTSPIDILTPLIARYNLPKGMMQNSIPIEKLSAKQTMQSVGSTGAPYTAPVNKYKSIVDSLKASGQDSSFASRKKLAEEKGITGYTGTAAQNMALMNALNSNNSYQNGGVYTVKSGDNLSKIASLNNMSLQNLLKSNPNIENPNLIYPGDRINISNKTIQTKAPVRQVLNATNYPITATDSYGRSDAYNNIYRNVNIPVKQNITKNKIINTPKALPNKKEQKPFIPSIPDTTNIPSIPNIPFNNENRHLESGMIEDKNKNLMYVIKDNQVVKTFPIMTGLSRNQNVNDKGLAWLEAHPKEARKYRATPTGTYLSNPNSNIYGHAGFNMQPIAAFGEPAPLARGLAQHVVYGMGPKGSSGYDPAEGRRRMKIMAGPDEQRIGSYGCTNMHGQDIDCLTGQLFPQGDTTIVVDTRLAKDKQFIQNFQHEQGGTAIFPSMRNFQRGGISYSNFLNKVDYPEMIQSDNVRSEYIPKTNTIYYDLPRSIPDELGHAYQRSIGNIGYSVPPNQNTMMREIPDMQDVYSVGRSNLDPKLVSDDAGFLNTIREKNVPNDSNNSLANEYIRGYFPGDEFAGDSYLNKINDNNIYFIPGSGEFEAHQISEPRIRNEFFDYRESKLNNNYNKLKYKQGGYYGMDQKFHPNSDSGTYVTGAGYYFDIGGGTASPASAPGTSGGVDVSGVPGAGAAGVTNGIRADGSFAVNDSKMPDGGYDGSGIMGDSAYEQSSPFDYNNSQFSEQSANKQQPYDPSQYTSEIDPSTGFTKYKKNGLAIRNIKREDPALWNHLKDEGHGARWATGQTDFQRVGRTAGAIGQGLEAGINVAGAIGGYLNNRNKQRNMDKSAMNMGSTASMFTNPQGSGKGDYGVTGSTYGQFKPNQSGNMSFKGMYGKYGMQVPSYQAGGGFSNLFTSAQTAMPVISPIELGNNIPMAYDIPINDNTRVSPAIIPVNVRQSSTQSNDNNNIKDLIATQESGGNYKALPWKDKAHTKLASSAAGKYQFLWGDHKDDIQKITGVKTKQDFLNNPNAQEEFFDYWDNTTLTPWANKIKSQLNIQLPINKIKAAIHFSGPKGAWNYFSKGIASKDNFGMSTGNYMNNFKYGGQQQGGQVVDMDENQIQQFLAAGGQLEFLD